MLVADDPRDERRPGGGRHRGSCAEHGDQQHDRDDRVHEDERHRGRHLDDAGRHEQTSGIVGIDDPAHRTREEEERDDAGRQQQTDLVRVGAVGLQAEGQGDQRHLVAEGRDHPPAEGDHQVASSGRYVKHMLNSIR